MRLRIEGPFEIDRKRDLDAGFISGGNHHPGVRELVQNENGESIDLRSMKLEMRLESGKSENEQEFEVKLLR